MIRLKDRNKQIPFSFKYYQAESRWFSPRHASFEVIVQALIAHRKGNPFLVQQHGWSTDYEQVCNEVDAYNARICRQMGWNDFIIGEGDPAPPLRQPARGQILQSGVNAVGGLANLVHWIRNRSDAVAPELANARAEICSTCPKNVQSDLTSFFTVPISNAIRAAINSRREMKLATPFDDKLGVCEACSCPIKLKVHFKLEDILKRIDPQAKAALDSRCWILKGQ